MEKIKMESIIESLLFVWGEPMSVKMISEALGVESKEVYRVLLDMTEKYESDQRGLIIRSFQLVSKRESFAYVEQLVRPIKKKKLSQSALEVLAIIAYRQPVTRGEVEGIRGVKSDKVIEGLINKGFVAEKGRSNTIGKPIIFGKTDKFLEYMNMSDLDELPDLDDFIEDFSQLSQWEKNQISIDDMEEMDGDRVSDVKETE